jgi:CheY-like chemotaxis protein
MEVPHGRPTVLVVDDERAIRSAMSRALRGHCRVLLAGGMGEAIACLRREAVDIVLADYMMPGGTGEHLFRAMSRDWPQVRRGLVSGTPPERLDELLAEGLVEVFVAKPWTFEELIGVVKRLSAAR